MTEQQQRDLLQQLTGLLDGLRQQLQQSGVEHDKHPCCSICMSHYSKSNPLQHFKTARHCRAARSAGEYCSLRCRWRRRKPRQRQPPLFAVPSDDSRRRLFWTAAGCDDDDTTVVCLACGGLVMHTAREDEEDRMHE